MNTPVNHGIILPRKLAIQLSGMNCKALRISSLSMVFTVFYRHKADFLITDIQVRYPWRIFGI